MSTARAPRRCAPTAALSPSPGTRQPVPRPHAGREPASASARCATASSPTARTCCARRSTWRSPNINLRDPALYRIRTRDASPHRRQVVHLPDVHLRAPDRGRAGEHHALASARSSSRTSGRSTTGCSSGSPRAACSPRPLPQQYEFARLNLTYVGHQQAQADPAGRGEARRRLGRPAHADARRRCAAAATRRRASGCSPSASACRRPTAGSTISVLEDCDARRPERASRRGASRCSTR